MPRAACKHERKCDNRAALAVARSQHVRTARLPIEDHVVVRKPSLTCLAVVQILAGYMRSRDWGAAVRNAPAMSVAPLKKYVQWKRKGIELGS